MRIQRPAKHRRRVSAGVMRETEKCIRQSCARFQVSRSFVIAVALADYFGVSGQEQFTEARRGHLLRMVK
jgi:hypothetical protein